MKAAGTQNIAGGIQGSAGVINQQLGYNAELDAQNLAHKQRMLELGLQYGQNNPG